MKLRAILALALAMPLALGGCGKKDEAPKQAAGGELLPRSVTDEMPPYDTVTSQPPLADPGADPGAGDEPGTRARRGGASGAASDEEVDSPVAPAAKPTPKPSPSETVRPSAE